MEELSKKIDTLRSKPQHVRERILVVCIAILVPILFTVWIATIQFDSPPSTGSSSSGFVDYFKHLFSGGASSPSADANAQPLAPANQQ